MPSVRNADCLDENVIAEFLQGLLSEEMAGRLEAHIDACASCRALVVGSSRSLTPWPGSAASRTPDEMAFPQTGEVIAEKYRIERLIGAGGMGVVVAAKHLLLNRTVALKFMRVDARAGAEGIERFMRDARALVRLKSEHATRVMDLGTLPSGAPYIVMEHLQGEDLGSLVAREGPLSVEVAASYVMQACDAISEAHRLGIVHRDIKPSNLFVTRGKEGEASIKVLDFGLSKISGSEIELPLTQTQALMGTPFFMAPEQLLSAREADARADLWGLGATLHFLVTGKPPFEADTIPELSAAVLRDPPQGLPATVPPGLVEVLSSCLEKDPGRRMASAEDLAAALKPLAAPPRKPPGNGAVRRRPDGPSRAASQKLSQPKRPRLRIIAAAFTACLAIGLALFFLKGTHPVVVLMDTPTEKGVYDQEVFEKSGTNADVLSELLRDLPLDLRKESLSSVWTREIPVSEMKPDLVVVHRSAFFHAVNAEVGLGNPPTGTKPEARWFALYDLADLRLMLFLALVGTKNTHTKFLIYSRGTDTRWPEEDYRKRWVSDFEKRFPEMLGRIEVMPIEGGVATGTFKNEEVAADIRERIVRMLGISDPKAP
jgi:serine/threonine protein kinase